MWMVARGVIRCVWADPGYVRRQARHFTPIVPSFWVVSEKDGIVSPDGGCPFALHPFYAALFSSDLPWLHFSGNRHVCVVSFSNHSQLLSHLRSLSVYRTSSEPPPPLANPLATAVREVHHRPPCWARCSELGMKFLLPVLYPT